MFVIVTTLVHHSTSIQLLHCSHLTLFIHYGIIFNHIYKKEFLECVNVNRDIQVQSHHHLLLIFLYQSNDLMNTY